MRHSFIVLISFLTLILILGCSNSEGVTSATTPPTQTDNESSGDDTPVLIEDRTGKKWDITHAIKNYGFQLERFSGGAGPFGIRPILNPQFIEPGDPFYPNPGETFLIIGIHLEGENRAYPISILGSREVSNDQFGEETHVAVAY